ncbi:MAG: hypothetical protein ACREKE_06275, partial [bacterium]
PELDLGGTLAPLFALALLNGWALLWAAGTFRLVAWAGWRPMVPTESVPMTQAIRHILWAAEEAFDQGRFERVPELLERVPIAERSPDVWLLLGRSHVLIGHEQDAVEALKSGGRRVPAGMGAAAIGRLPNRMERLPAFGALVLALLLAVGGLWTFIDGRISTIRRPVLFDEMAFRSMTDGRLTFFYHDPAFRDFADPLAQDALNADLDFLGLGPDTFGPGQVHIYLCDSLAEYRRRAPYDPPWEAACADPPRASVYIHRFGSGGDGRLTFEVVLAHELGHLCYYHLVGRSPDDWLNEGLADYLGFRFGLDREGVPRQAWLQDHFFRGLRAQALPFDRFFSVEPRSLPDAQVATFYRQGFSVVYLLVEDYGRGPFLVFLKALSGGGDVNRALAEAYPTIPNVASLAAVWGLFYPKTDASPAHPGI